MDKNSNVWTCPNTPDSVKYKGKCPNLSCPANISHIPDRPSGCFYNFMNNKPDIGKYEIAHAFSTTHKAVEETIAYGSKRIKQLMLFHKIINQAKLIQDKRHCHKCYIERTSAGPCINTVECGKRSRILKNVLDSYPFNVKELKVSPIDVYKIIGSQQVLHRLIHQIDASATLETVLDIGPLFNKLINMKTKV